MNGVTRNSNHRHTLTARGFSYGPLAYLAFILLALAVSWMTTTQYSTIPFVIIGVLSIILVCIITFYNPFYGYCINLVLAFFAFYPQLLFKLPASLTAVSEGLIYICFIAALVKQKGSQGKGTLMLFRSPITIGMLVFLCYVFIEFLNPNITKLSWLFAFRKLFPVVILYFTAFLILDSYGKVVKFFNLFIFLCALASLYACIQQYFGYFPFEMDYILSSPGLVGLYFQWGMWRKFSFMSDVVSFSMNTAVAGLFILILTLYEKSVKQIILLLLLALFIMIGMSFSGTRAANFILPAGLILFCVMHLNRVRTIAILGTLAVTFLLLLYAPVNRFVTLNRFRSAFKGGDASLDVRNMNRHAIQPYIHAHPIGGGLVSSGATGEIMNPGHFLATFPPDSGLLQSALEKGWVGLTLDMLLYTLIIVQGIQAYFRSRTDKVKKYYMAITACSFGLMLGEYAQMVVFQIPMFIFYFTCAALMTRLKLIDQELYTLNHA